MLFNKKYKLRIAELEAQLENEKDVVAKKATYIMELKHDFGVGLAENRKAMTLIESKVVLLTRANEILTEQRRLDIELITMQSKKLTEEINANQSVKQENDKLRVLTHIDPLNRANPIIRDYVLDAPPKTKSSKKTKAKTKRKYVRSGKFAKAK